MARTNLSQLLGMVASETTPTHLTAELNGPSAEPARAASGPGSSAPSASIPKHPAPTAQAQTQAQTPAPLYATLLRKETRIRFDQQTQLTLLARRLTQRRKTPGVRITENTLIRIAIDLLLAYAGELDGADEATLRRTVGLP
jgi:hypothetical protein